MRVSGDTPRSQDPILELQREPTPADMREDEFVRDQAKAGARLGFKIGSAATLVGIPLTQTLTDAEGKGHKARTARKRIKLWAVIGFPGVFAGSVGAAVGAAIGAAAARVSLAFRKKG